MLRPGRTDIEPCRSLVLARLFLADVAGAPRTTPYALRAVIAGAAAHDDKAYDQQQHKELDFILSSHVSIPPSLIVPVCPEAPLIF